VKSMRPIRKLQAGDLRVHPFNHVFTDQEKKVFQLIAQLRTTTTALKKELARTPIHACAPPEKYKPAEMEQIVEIEQSLDSLDLDLRWLPGGAYRYE
jgi:hypothetical protein